MARPVLGVESELDVRLAGLGFELVLAEWAGSARRPILRVRIDVSEERARRGEGVTVGECARVSRVLEAWLDTLEQMPERYVLEVSSPGLDRPLTRAGDWERFKGQRVAVKGPDVLAGRARRLEGELLGLRADEGEGELVRLRLPGGDEVEVPKGDISAAHLVFEWQ